MISPETALQLTLPTVTEQLVDDIATSAVRDFLGSLDPVELETRALSLLGGLEGEDSVGVCFLKVLHEMAELQ